MSDDNDLTRREFLDKGARTGAAVVGYPAIDTLVKGGLAALAGLEVLLDYGCAHLSFKEEAPVIYPLLPGHKVQPPKDGCFFGLNYGARYQLGHYKNYEHSLGKAPKVAMLHHMRSYLGFPMGDVTNLIEDGLIPLVTWDPVRIVSMYSLKGIASGNADDDIRVFAKDAAKVKHPYFIRNMIEMNLPSGGMWAYSGQPKYYGKAWRRFWQIFADEGANEYVTWVWNPYVHYYGTGEKYYPGDEYVDWIGFDGYNGGSSRNMEWEPFDGLFESAYKSTRKKHPLKPIMICEFACNEERGHDKAKWITDAYNSMKEKHPGIKAVIYFNENWRGPHTNIPMLGAITTSQKSLEAFKKAIANPYFIGR